MSGRRIQQKIPYYLLMAPAVILSVCVILIPSITTIVSSFTDWNGISSDMNFVGASNYAELIGDSVFGKALTNNIKWMIMYLTVPVLLALAASMCLLKQKKGRSVFQVIFLLPYVIAPIANALIWLNMIYSPVTGLFGFLKNVLGWSWISSPLTSTDSALVGVAVVDIWHYWGYLAVVFLSALRQTPSDYIEAATVDGCNGWQLFRYVYFPSMLPTFKLMMVLIVIQSFLQFDYVYLLTSGGPAHATEMLGTLTYNYAFTLFQFGKAAAIAVMMSVLGLIASVIYARMNRSESQ
ncbi:Inner membrane ABC transporter permease protein ycjO [uncultured Flavonifractor sp.]|nr:Inner membrane ABC transporter permease protein ycjO [uncultured Flavonifractor sp.]